MKGRLTLQQRLVIPIILLGLVAFLSNVLAVFSINNVHANAGTIVDEYMVSEGKLEEIRRSLMDIHRLALSHIVAADHATMIRLVQEIKAEEAALDEQLSDYAPFASGADEEVYRSLLSSYDSFKHALVYLVCASADSKTQEAYNMANGDVASWSAAAEQDIDTLYASVSSQAAAARSRLTFVYVTALVISAATLVAGVLLVAAAFRIIRKHVIAPIQDAMGTLQDSSERISGVTQEVRQRTRTSSGSVRDLSGLTEQLSAALEEIASSTSSIRGGTTGTQSDAQDMAEECSAITAYSVEMRGRAEVMEQSALRETEAVRAKTAEIMTMLDQAIEKSRSVDQISVLTKAGAGFSVVAQEVHKLADSCAETASHIQKVSGEVTGAVSYLAESARELAGYLSQAILTQLEQSVQAGQQYRQDSDYIGRAMEAFNQKTVRLKAAMDEIAGSISSISGAIDGAASGITGAAGNTRVLVDDMASITARMDINQEIVEELQKQMDVFANL